MDAILQAFGLGLLSAGSPCLLPLYPGFIAYLAANSQALRGRRAAGLLGLVVLAGILTTMLAIGLFLSAVSAPLGAILVVLVPIADLAIVALGIALVAGRNPFHRLASVNPPLAANPYGQAYLYGVLLGPLALPCAGAYVVALFAISLGVLDAIPHVVLFIAFGLGFGVPLVGLSIVSAARGQALVRIAAAHFAEIERGAGLVLIAIGAWDLVQNLPALRAGLGV